MKRLSTLLLLLIAFSAGVFAQANNQVVCSFDHKAGANAMVLDQTVFTIWNNKKVKLTRAEFYISEVELHHPDGTMMPLTDQYILVNALNPTADYPVGSWPIESAHGATLHLGVPQAVNHNDPAALPSSSPLSPQNPTMHWGWSAGYRFMAIEGMVDNNNDGVPETLFEFHNLGDALYKTVELTGQQDAANGVLHLHFVLDYIQLFKNMAMTGTLIQHGSAAINNTMMTNAATQNFIAMAAVSATQQVESNSLNIKAMPNPANAETILEYNLPATGAISMNLTNALGQTVRTFSDLSAAGNVRLETAALPEGIYQYSFYENGSLLARKQLIVKH
jgi:hypothetical protein